jgi:hypothetical protein
MKDEKWSRSWTLRLYGIVRRCSRLLREMKDIQQNRIEDWVVFYSQWVWCSNVLR